MTRARRHWRHAARVAGITAVVVLVGYVAAVVVFDHLVSTRLVAQTDQRLRTALQAAHTATGPGRRLGGGDIIPIRTDDVDDSPIFLWTVSHHDLATAHTAFAPHLGPQTWSTAPRTEVLQGTAIRLDAIPDGSGWMVAGESVSQNVRVSDALLPLEILGGILIFVVVFAGAFLVGLRASAPLEEVGRRQAEFTADASHELRTPLSVIEAEVDLALRKPRSTPEYRATLQRVAGEGARLRRIVEDLLWLARVDGEPERPEPRETVDVGAIAAASADRFATLARERGIHLDVEEGPDGPYSIVARAEWVDRLTGVLVDNVCAHAGPGAHATVAVTTAGNRVVLRVDDDGPGIPEDQWDLVRDRFHRAEEGPRGTGLGLAIADSVVAASHGVLRITRSPAGGARVEASWRRAARRGPSTGASPSVPGSRSAATSS